MLARLATSIHKLNFIEAFYFLTASIAHTTDLLTHTTDHVTNTTGHLAHTTDHVSNTTDHVAHTTDHIAHTTDHLIHTTVGLLGISIFSNIEVSFFKGIRNVAFLVNTVIPYIAILSTTLAIFSKKVSLARSILQLPQ